MNRFFIRLFHGLLLLAFLHAQLAFSGPDVSALIDLGCSQHADETVADQHQHRQLAHSHVNTKGDHDHREHEEHRTCGDVDPQCDHSCKGDGCCSGCGVCGHCSTALIASSQALVPITTYHSCGVSSLPQELRSSRIFHPPQFHRS
jgi:hypothetical protein